MVIKLLKRVSAVVIITALLAAGSGCFVFKAPPATTSEVESGIFQLVNEERTGQGLPALTRNTSLDALAREYAASKFAESTGYSTDLIYLVCNTWMLDFGSSSPSLTADTAADQVDYCLGQPGMRDAMLRPEAEASVCLKMMI